jgi:hypothetical protein
MASTRSQLTQAMHERRIVKFSRRFEKTSPRGYVLDIGPKFFLLALVSDRIWLDGFECFGIADVRNLRRDPYGDFAEAAMLARGERLPPKKPRVSVASIGELLRTASRAFPLIAIHRELVNPRVCWIGRVAGITRTHVQLLEIDPNASWDKTPNDYRLSEITHVNFGGDYEDALNLLGGEPH